MLRCPFCLIGIMEYVYITWWKCRRCGHWKETIL